MSEMIAARREIDDRVMWQTDKARVKRVIVKLARGHIAYEMEPQLGTPTFMSVLPLNSMVDAYGQEFEHEDRELQLWPEIGTRAMMRLAEGVQPFEWLVVQASRYRYRITWDIHIAVRLVIRDYLAAIVVWEA